MGGNLTLNGVAKKVTEQVTLEQNKHLRPMVILTFDDGYESDYNIVRPIFAELGLKGTFFIIGSRIGYSERYMNAAQIKEMAEIGHEIGSHTLSHPYLTELSMEEMINEFKESKRAIQEVTGVPVETLCYPYGDNDENVRDIAGGFFIGARAFWNLERTNFKPIYTGNRLQYVIPYGTKYLFGLPGRSGDTMHFWEFVDTINDFLNLKEPGCYILVFHRIHRDDDTSKPEDRLNESEFRRMMEYLNERKRNGDLDVVTFAEGIKRLHSARSVYLE